MIMLETVSSALARQFNAQKKSPVESRAQNESKV